MTTISTTTTTTDPVNTLTITTVAPNSDGSSDIVLSDGTTRYIPVGEPTPGLGMFWFTDTVNGNQGYGSLQPASTFQLPLPPITWGTVEAAIASSTTFPASIITITGIVIPLPLVPTNPVPSGFTFADALGDLTLQ